MQKLEGIETKLNKILEILTYKGHHIQDQDDDNADEIINERNVMVIPTRDEYTFGLDLLGMLFTKEETGNCLIYKSPKSTKQALAR